MLRKILFVNLKKFSLKLFFFFVDLSEVILHELFNIDVLISCTFSCCPCRRSFTTLWICAGTTFSTGSSHLWILPFYTIHAIFFFFRLTKLLFSAENYWTRCWSNRIASNFSFRRNSRNFWNAWFCVISSSEFMIRHSICNCLRSWFWWLYLLLLLFLIILIKSLKFLAERKLIFFNIFCRCFSLFLFHFIFQMILLSLRRLNFF